MLIIAINAFSQRYETFRDLQYDSFTRAIKKMIQNVKTRWDNTFFMLQRAKFMKKTIHKWLAQTNSKLKILTLFKKKWNQVYYMIELLEFFHNVTKALNTTHDFIILEAWKTYNSLHDHLKKIRSQIRQQFRESSWVVKLHEIILVDTKMLKKYYEATCDKKSTYFNVEALLNFMKKENVYSVSCFDFYCCILSLFFLLFVHRHLLLSLLLLSIFYRCFLSLLFIVAFYRCFLSLLSIAIKADLHIQLFTWTSTKKKLNLTKFREFYNDHYLRFQLSNYESRQILESNKRQSLFSIVASTRNKTINQRQFDVNKQSNASSSSTKETNEVVLWLKQSMSLFEIENLLTVWSDMITQYSTLSRMTKDILIISIFDVDVERLFFMTRDVMIYRRNRLRDHTIENIMILKRIDWLAEDFINDADTILFVIAKNMKIDELVDDELMLNTTWAIESNFDDIFDVSNNDYQSFSSKAKDESLTSNVNDRARSRSTQQNNKRNDDKFFSVDSLSNLQTSFMINLSLTWSIIEAIHERNTLKLSSRFFDSSRSKSILLVYLNSTRHSFQVSRVIILVSREKRRSYILKNSSQSTFRSRDVFAKRQRTYT